MAQFDVFAKPGRRDNTVPFVVDLQSTRYSSSATRLVAPLVLRGRIPRAAAWLAPTFVIAGTTVVLDVFNLATIPAALLGAPVAALADEESRAKLVHALDEFLSQA